MYNTRAYSATSPTSPLTPTSIPRRDPTDRDVQIEILFCGICHSDLSLLNNDWGMTRYPFVPGHEATGRVVAMGNKAKGVSIGQRVGLGWNSHSCMHCKQCLMGHQNLCESLQPTLIGRHGAFANKVRAHWVWTMPLPEGLDSRESGPLLCGGITVFAPLRELNISPTARVGVVGIGGLGHMALKFCKAWGCEVTAFTSSDSKAEEARAFGAHHVVSTGDSKAIEKLAEADAFGSLGLSRRQALWQVLELDDAQLPLFGETCRVGTAHHDQSQISDYKSQIKKDVTSKFFTRTKRTRSRGS